MPKSITTKKTIQIHTNKRARICQYILNLKVLNVTLPVLPGTPPGLIQEGNKGQKVLTLDFEQNW